MSMASAPRWRHARGTLALERAGVMAIVNLTPDSFSDGGRWHDPSGAVVLERIAASCRAWVEQGALVLDLGGESTRPGARPLEASEELARVLPVLERLRADPALCEVPISIDTRHAAVARVALAQGAAIINDVSGLADPDMAAVVAAGRAGLVIGHMRGEPATMQDAIAFDDLLGEIVEELGLSLARARAAGVARESILVDPCVGFGKTSTQSAALVAAASLLERELGVPVLIGASRKRFLSQWTHEAASGQLDAAARTNASVAAALAAVAHGAVLVRVHDVEPTLEALRVWSGIAEAYEQARAVALGLVGAARSEPA